VIAGVVLLAAAAFTLSYAGIHQIALRAGVSPELAKLYPVMFDAMLVVSGAAVLALRGAGGWARAYAWSSLLLMLVVVAVGDALHTTNVTLPAQPTRIVVAVTPWVLLLLAFGLWLELLRHFRRMRAANGQHGQGPGYPVMTDGASASGQGANGVTGNGSFGAGQRTAVTWASAGGAGQGRPLPPPPAGLDALLGPREVPPPALPGTGHDDVAAGGYPGYPGHADAGQYLDPVSYGETGYVHPDSYLGDADYGAHAAVGALAVTPADGDPGKQPVPGPAPSTAQTAGSAIAASPAAEGPRPAAESSPAATAETGFATGQTSSATTETGSATGQTGSATGQTGSVTAETGSATGRTGPAKAQTGSATGQTGSATAQSGSATAQASPATGQTGSATAQTDSATAQTGLPTAQTAPTSAQNSPAAAQTDPGAAQNAAAEPQTAPDQQSHPGEGQDSPNSAGDTAPATASASASATADPGPRFERLRSTPARPTE
jgi:hypothetical protein